MGSEAHIDVWLLVYTSYTRFEKQREPYHLNLR
jgi:hypothetical protein